MTQTQDYPSMDKYRTHGLLVETIPTLKLVHDALELALQTKDSDLMDAAETLYSTLVMGMRYHSQYIPWEMRLFIKHLQEKLHETAAANGAG